MYPELMNNDLKSTDIFNLSIKIIKSICPQVIRIFLVFFLPVVFMESIIYIFLQDDMQAILYIADKPQMMFTSEFEEIITSFWINQLALFLVRGCIMVIGYIAIIKLTIDAITYKDKERYLHDATATAFNLYLSAVGLTLFTSSIITISTIFIIPAIYFTFIWGFYLQALVRGKKGKKALENSSIIVKNNLKKIISLVALCMFAFGSYSIIIIYLDELLISTLSISTRYIITTFLTIMFSVFLEIVRTVFYVHLECTTFGTTINNEFIK